jgi:polysaccharide biosynthesis/export protein
MNVLRRWLIAAAGAAALAAVPPGLAAQRPDTSAMRLDPRLLQRGVPQSDALERLRASGITRQQARAELQRRGYDPSLADPYFDVLEREQGGRGGRDSFIDALTGTGLARDTARGARDTARPGLRTDPGELDFESLFGLTAADLAAPGELPVFGASFFRRNALTLDEAEFGPVDAGYRLGPGDEVNLILTGAVQDAYPLRIGREGTLVVPDVGELMVNGLTLAALEDLLRARLSGVYASGLTRVSVSLGRVRSIQVYVIGDVERPGPYQLSGLGTVMGALYRAGGPSRTGSFREIEVRRGSTIVRRLDLYEYLLHGNSQVDLRLQHGDVVFVPPVARRVRLEGALRRPALYELLAGDGLRDALRFAGGPEAEASLRRVQIDRIVPPAERMPGIERVVVDVDVVRLLAPGGPDVPLQDGDRVRVDSVVAERRNLVTLVGEVRRPGTYAWSVGTTLGDVLDRASGVTEAAYTGRAHVFRFDVDTGERRLLSAPLDVDEARVVILEDRDSVVVYSRARLTAPEYITVGGLVQRPGRYPLHEGATVHDVILAAGGLAEGASRSEAYVARPNDAATEMEAGARTFRVPLGLDPSAARGATPAWTPDAGEFVLRHGDRVEIRRSPGFELPRTVVITGEVAQPGTYVLETRADRVSGLLQAAGGLTPDAHLPGLHVVRNGQILAADVARAVARAGSADDVVLEEGDTVRVPRFDPTILVTGAVVHDSTRVLYRPGMSVHDVVREAGGFTRVADRNRLTVTYQNGVRTAVRTLPLQPDRQPTPEPGSTVYVPERPPGVQSGLNWGMLISQAIAAAGAIATLIIALNN